MNALTDAVPLLVPQSALCPHTDRRRHNIG